MLRLTFLACAAALAMPAAAQTAPAAAPQAARQTPAPDKEKKVCKVDTSTGSIMPKRICKTADEWAAVEAANSGVPDQLRQWQQNNRTVSSGR
jgi:uncharacterized protein involved in copper resistance